ncbi:2-dehydro-3-deoxy-D-arabinonate dehydratase [Actinocrispum wychmicini]|uniref:2-dehydro-3-deoxy-D-arabinonate dehydratase n=1 Tax=Actinocrispum wychmicini TaxID=1213861 RepID=A0A4R2K0N9_9PSEU|nr:2-dehydro-3-deoxy-D-arabinonate dehydratase [Actinocrispum wychmicini]
MLPANTRIADLLTVPLNQARLVVQLAETEVPAQDVQLLSPLDGAMEVWAAGVTYSRSRDARVEESSERSIYDRVYDAERPELFFKAPAWRVVTDGEPIAVRDDSAVNVPEPELGLVVNAFGEIAGYLVVNDVSSRSIEGENPLYLPQAKVYAGSCAVSAGIVPSWLVEADDLTIEMVVRRGAEVVFTGSTSTREFHRSPAALVPYLLDWLEFPEGVVLSTGTGIVPDLDFDLAPGDVVEITIESIGRLVNPVVGVKEWISRREEK